MTWNQLHTTSNQQQNDTLKEYASKLTDKFISNNVITFEYSKQNGKLYMARDSR